jgi:hypothetical protein
MNASKEAFKKQEEEKGKLRKERDERCLPFVDKVFEIVNERRPSMNIDSKEKLFEEYSAVIKEVLESMKEADLTIDDVRYIVRLCKVRMDIITEQVEHSINVSKYDFEEKNYGKPAEQLTLKELDKVLIDKTE